MQFHKDFIHARHLEHDTHYNVIGRRTQAYFQLACSCSNVSFLVINILEMQFSQYLKKSMEVEGSYPCPPSSDAGLSG